MWDVKVLNQWDRERLEKSFTLTMWDVKFLSKVNANFDVGVLP